MVETLLDSGATVLVIILEFAKKQRFILKKIKRPIYIRNVGGMLNKKGLIENTVKDDIYYQGYKERAEINIIRE